LSTDPHSQPEGATPAPRAPFDAQGMPRAPLLAGHDWRGSALGHPAGWPRALQAAATQVFD
jgi:hypothetical protein